MDGHRVLVVEDERMAREALQIILASRGWIVSKAATVAEGLAQLDPPPDCIILDLDLPDGPGEVVLRRVREDNLTTRVTITTGCDDAARLDAVARLKPECLLRKPVNIEALLAACGTGLATLDAHDAPDALGRGR